MRYQVLVEKQQVFVDLQKQAEGGWQVSVDGQTWHAQVHGGEVELRASPEQTPERWLACAIGKRWQVELGSLRSLVEVKSTEERSRRQQARGGSAARVLAAPMPGRVVKVLAAPGQKVKEGQLLLIMEAMKMENSLLASGEATIQAVHVKPGDSVEAGAALVDFEKAHSGDR